MGVLLNPNKPQELEGIRERESDIIKERIQLILKAGANVILTTKGIDSLCLKYCMCRDFKYATSNIYTVVEAGAMAVRRCKKEDLKRIAKATGGQVLLTLANLEGEESYDATNLGIADEVVEERIADDECILIKTDNKRSSSIILRFVLSNPHLTTTNFRHTEVLTELCSMRWRDHCTMLCPSLREH